MKIILLGAAGSGKGTQCEMLTKALNIPSISTGDLFRDNIKNQTPIGIKAQSYVNRGVAVPDEVVLTMLKERLNNPDCKNGYILDGFPRNANQAKELEKITKIDHVFSIEVSKAVLLNRITGRRICDKCKHNSHIDWLQGKTTCPKCGGSMLPRKDDSDPEAVKRRLEWYENDIKPLADYYAKQGILTRITGDEGKESIFAQISKVLK